MVILDLFICHFVKPNLCIRASARARCTAVLCRTSRWLSIVILITDEIFMPEQPEHHVLVIAETGLGPQVTRLGWKMPQSWPPSKMFFLFWLLTGVLYGGAVVNMVASNVEGSGDLGLLTVSTFLSFPPLCKNMHIRLWRVCRPPVFLHGRTFSAVALQSCFTQNKD